MKNEDWGDSMDDMEPGYWEEHLGGPDDDELEMLHQNHEYEDIEVDYPGDGKIKKPATIAVENDQNEKKRQREIINWLASLKCSIKFKKGNGFFVPKGPQIRISENNVMDLLEWLDNEGIKGGKSIEGFNIVYANPESKYGEKLSFFKTIVDSPFSPKTESP